MDRIIIAKKENGRYKAFPTVIKNDNDIIIAYRNGVVDVSKPHGKDGCVVLLRSRDLKSWQTLETPFCDNELDAIISKVFDDKLILATRSFEYKKRNESYVSIFDAHCIPSERKKVEIKGVNLAAFFGHMFEFGKEIIATAYGTINKITKPLVVASNDAGLNWYLKSAITNDNFEPILNETTIFPFNGEFIAIMRSKEPSYDLYISHSKNLIDWSIPEKMGILGHAPMAKTTQKGKAVFVFRDLNDDLPGVSVAVSSNLKDWNIINIRKYSGNLYNGGYADFVEIEQDRLFVVYYVCDEDNEPWIEAAFIDIGDIK